MPPNIEIGVGKAGNTLNGPSAVQFRQRRQVERPKDEPEEEEGRGQRRRVHVHQAKVTGDGRHLKSTLQSPIVITWTGLVPNSVVVQGSMRIFSNEDLEECRGAFTVGKFQVNVDCPDAFAKTNEALLALMLTSGSPGYAKAVWYPPRPGHGSARHGPVPLEGAPRGVPQLDRHGPRPNYTEIHPLSPTAYPQLTRSA